jgi:hypothetical protein
MSSNKQNKKSKQAWKQNLSKFFKCVYMKVSRRRRGGGGDCKVTSTH